MLLSRKISMGLVSVAVLLAGCGGGGGSNGGGAAAVDDSSASAPSTASAPDTASAPNAASAPQPSAFACPANYKRLDIPAGTVGDVPMTMVTDDNIATLTFKTPSGGVTRDVTVCLGKPDPLPTGVQADYAYEITAHGNFLGLENRTLTFSFTTTQPVTGVPAIEVATVGPYSVTYSPTIASVIVATRPNYSINAHPNQTGLFVIRLTK